MANRDHGVDLLFKFVDQQLKGPYRMWHHAHTFHAADGGTMVEDTVHYRPVGGALVHELFVRRYLQRIFMFRQGGASWRRSACRHGIPSRWRSRP